MNIFALDNDTKKCAQYHVDKHVVKMILESAQLLSTACKLNGVDYGYKATHTKHPSNLWLLESFQNVLWLKEMSLHLCDEFTFRYDKEHKSKTIIENIPLKELEQSYIKQNIPTNHLTKFRLAMPDKYKCEDPIKSYRDYYVYEKNKFASWKRREVPEWWIQI